MGGRPVGVCRAPPRVPTRDTPTVVLVVGGTPVGATGPGPVDIGWGGDPAVGVHPHPVSGVRACLRRVAGRDVVGGIAIGVGSRGVGAWIPAFAGMTRWGAGNDEVGVPEWRIGRVNSARPHPDPQRGTSPSPRVVFDRPTLALGRLLPISRLAFCRGGFVRGFPPRIGVRGMP